MKPDITIKQFDPAAFSKLLMQSNVKIVGCDEFILDGKKSQTRKNRKKKRKK